MRFGNIFDMPLVGMALIGLSAGAAYLVLAWIYGW